MENAVIKNISTKYLPCYFDKQIKSKFSYDIYKAARDFAIVKFLSTL